MPSHTLRDPLVAGAVEHYDDAVYYDFTYRGRRSDVAYYRRLARQHGGPVLELGGGTGRIGIPIARDGNEVVVLDASPPMLERAAARLDALEATERKRVKLVHGDMRQFALRRKFALVVAPFNVLLHLYEPDEFAACFTSVARHLAPGARFVFDVRMPDLRELLRDPRRVYPSRGFRHPTLGHRIEYTERFAYDPIKQVQHVRIRFEPARGAPAGARTQEVLLSQRQIFPNELRGLLALGGLRLAARHGDFTGRALAQGDSVQIVTAVRA